MFTLFISNIGHIIQIKLDPYFLCRCWYSLLCLSHVSADPDGVGPGRVLSQTQTEAQTGASHQPDVWEQLRGGEGLMDRWMDEGMWKKNGGGGSEGVLFF